MRDILDGVFNRIKKRLFFKEVFKKETEAVQNVMADLDKFCDRNVCRHAGYPIDEKTVFIAIGRRQVFDYIQRMADISDEEINKMIEQEKKNNERNIF